jgi:hypothetical protein
MLKRDADKWEMQDAYVFDEPGKDEAGISEDSLH